MQCPVRRTPLHAHDVYGAAKGIEDALGKTLDFVGVHTLNPGPHRVV